MERNSWESYDPAIAVDFVAKEEGFRGEAYKCPADVWTIGHGHTAGVKEGDTITREDARALLRDDLRGFAKEAGAMVRVPVTEGQYIALLDFVFNLGVAQFAASTLLRKLNAGDYDEVAEEFPRWVYVNGEVSKGLLARRERERALFKGEKQ